MTNLQRSFMLLSLISFGVTQTKAETIVDNSKGNSTKVSDKNGITVVDIDSPNEKGISVERVKLAYNNEEFLAGFEEKQVPAREFIFKNFI